MDVLLKGASASAPVALSLSGSGLLDDMTVWLVAGLKSNSQQAGRQMRTMEHLLSMPALSAVLSSLPALSPTTRTAYRAMLQGTHRLAAQLFKRCCAAVDSVAGTSFVGEEKRTESSLNEMMRLAARVAPDQVAVRELAVGMVVSTWLNRQDVLAPLLRCAAALGAGAALCGSDGGGGSTGRAIRGGETLQTVAAQRELAFAAAGWCANPLCQPAEHCDQRRQASEHACVGKRRCAGCRVDLYCRWGWGCF